MIRYYQRWYILMLSSTRLCNIATFRRRNYVPFWIPFTTINTCTAGNPKVSPGYTTLSSACSITTGDSDKVLTPVLTPGEYMPFSRSPGGRSSSAVGKKGHFVSIHAGAELALPAAPGTGEYIMVCTVANKHPPIILPRVTGMRHLAMYALAVMGAPSMMAIGTKKAVAMECSTPSQ